MRILGALTPEPLIVADHHRTSPTLDAEVKTLLLLPRGAEVKGGDLPSSETSQPDACSGRLSRESFRQAPVNGQSLCASLRSRKVSRTAMSVSRDTGIWRKTRMSKARTLAASPPLLIDDTNLSRAWARLLLQVLDGSGTEVAPLVLSLSGFALNGAAVEDPTVRQVLDQLLMRKGRIAVENVAFTVFPQRLWEMSRGNRARLFARYREVFPRWQAMNRKANGRGLYFERMVMYGRGPCHGNQLEWILSQFNSRRGVRRSMLQATTFDPGRDHVGSARLGFPCLQQGELRADRRRSRY